MRDLETEVREALIEQEANKFLGYFNKNPVYKEGFDEAFKYMVNDFCNSIFSMGRFSENEKIRIKKELLDETLSEFTGKNFKERCYEIARNDYVSVEQLREKAGKSIRQLKEAGEISEGTEATFELLSESYLDFARVNDLIVKRLADLAKTNSLENVLMDERRYEIIRGIFPDSKNYREFLLDKKKFTFDAFRKTSDALIGDNKEAAKFIDIASCALRKTFELIREISDEYTEREVAEIYK